MCEQVNKLLHVILRASFQGNIEHKLTHHIKDSDKQLLALDSLYFREQDGALSASWSTRYMWALLVYNSLVCSSGMKKQANWITNF